MQSPTRRTRYPKKKHSTLDGGNFPDAEALKLCSGFVNNHKCRYAISYRFAIATMTYAMRNALTPANRHIKPQGFRQWVNAVLPHTILGARAACCIACMCHLLEMRNYLRNEAIGVASTSTVRPAGATSHMMTTVIVSRNSPVARVDKVLCQLRHL